MSLNAQTSAVYNQFHYNSPQYAEASARVRKVNSDFQASFDPSATIQVGDALPEFRLKNATGKEVSSTELLDHGPLLITFYRGEWCPFCNLALAAMQKHLEDFKAKGVTLVAITPEIPDASLNTTEKHQLKFPVLSDVGNHYAKKLGITFQQPDSMRPVFKAMGHDLVAYNGDDSLVVPIPASLLVDQKGVVRNTFIDPEYSRRLEPSTALEWIDALQK